MAVAESARRLRMLLAAPTAALVCTLAACGGGSDSGSVPLTPVNPTPTPSPSPSPSPPPPGPQSLGFTVQPGDQTVVAPAAASFSVAASGDNVTFRWQMSIDGGAVWNDLPAATAAYTTGSTSAGMNGLMLRALASNATGTVASDPATLAVRTAGAPAATLQLLAGSIAGAGSRDGAGRSARFSSPGSIAIDGAGALVIWDGFSVTGDSQAAPSAPCLRRISAEGFVSTTALPVVQPAYCNDERQFAFDAAGNMYFNNRDGTIRKLTADGVLTALGASVSTSGGVAVDAAGNVFVADQGNSVILRITPAGVVTTIAGTAGVRGSADGTGTAALFNFPYALVVDRSGNLIVADQFNHTLRKVTAAGVVTTLAGLAGQWGAADGTGSAARFAAPSGLAIDAADNVYVADRDNSTIRKVTPAGVVATVAGAAGQHDYADGAGNAARFRNPMSVAIDRSGNLFVADTGNAAIRRISSDGLVTTWAGAGPGVAGSADGMRAAASFRSPIGLAAAANGTVYVADTGNHTIRQISAAGDVTTLAGFAMNPGNTDASGPVARFNAPSDLALDAAGNILVTDTGNGTVRSVTTSGQVSLRLARAATGIDVRAGNIYLGRNNVTCFNPIGPCLTYSQFERIDAAGSVLALAGKSPDASDFALGAAARDGPGDQALFGQSGAIAADAAGNVLVADRDNCAIRRISASGATTTVAGRLRSSPGDYFCAAADGPGDTARFRLPEGLAFDGSGNLYVADTGNHTIRKIAPDGTVTTVLGVVGQSGIVLGASPSLSSARRIAWLGGNRFAITSGNAVLIATLP